MNHSLRILAFCLTGALFVALSRSSFGRHQFAAGYLKQIPMDVRLEKALEAEKVVDVVVVGSGVAGLSAAMYGGRFGLHTLVVSGKLPGGQLTETSYVENWPGFEKELGADIVNNLKKQALKFGALYLNDTITSIDISKWPYVLTTLQGEEITALSIVLATGAEPRRLNVPGESQYWGRGVSSCAICDAPFFKDKNVVVVGGGDSAVEEAIQLAMAGARTVTLFVRTGKMRAAKTMQERLASFSNITVRYNVQITEVIGDGSAVTGLKIVDSASGTNQPDQVSVDGLFLAIGHVPNTTWLKNVVAMDDDGYIRVSGRTQKTNVPGIFVAGEAEDRDYRQAAVEAGRGVSAMIDASRFLAEIGLNDSFSKKLEQKRFAPGKELVGFVQEITTLEQYESAVLDNTHVLIDFYTTTCSACSAMLPDLKAYARKAGDTVKVVKINGDKLSSLAQQFKIISVPTLVMLKNGKEVARVVGAHSKPQIENFVKKTIN